MAVLEVNLLFTSRGGKEGLDRQRTYTRVYEVITDDPADDEQTVGNAPGLPSLGDSLAADPDAVVISLAPEQSDDSDTLWYVTVEYDSNPPTHDKDKPDNKVDLDQNTIDKTAQENPLNEPAVWAITFEDAEEPAIEGISVKPDGTLDIPIPDAWAANTAYKVGKYVKNGGNVYRCVAAGTSAGAGGPAGKGEIVDNTCVWDFWDTLANVTNDPNAALKVAILNSGKLPFDPPATTAVSRVVLEVTKNMPFTTLEYLLALKNAVNLFPWRGLPARTAKIKSVSADGGKEKNGVQYVTGKWQIALDPDTWDLRLLDQGFGYLDTRTDPATLQPVTKYVRFVDVNGEPLDQPVPLNGAGSPLEPGDPPVFLRFVPRQTRLLDFNGILPF